MKAKRFLVRMFVMGITMSWACSGVGPLDPLGVELRVTAENVVLEAIGARTQLALELPDGMTTVGLDVNWRSSAPGVVSVDGSGRVTALGQGVATISAQAGGLSASTLITVDAEISNTARVQSDQTDPNPANNTATNTVTVQAN